MWRREKLIRWIAVLRRDPLKAVSGFCVGLFLWTATNWFENFQRHQASVFEHPGLGVSFLQILFAPIGIVTLVWLLGTLQFPAKVRERALGLFILSMFAGCILAALVALMAQFIHGISALF